MKLTLAVVSVLVAAVSSAHVPKGAATLLQPSHLTCHSQVLPLLQKSCRHGSGMQYCVAQNFTAFYPKTCPQGLFQSRIKNQCKSIKSKPINGNVIRNQCIADDETLCQAKKNSPQIVNFIDSIQNALARQPTKSITKRYVKENIRNPTAAKSKTLKHQEVTTTDKGRADRSQEAVAKVIIPFQKGRMCRTRVVGLRKRSGKKAAKKA
ncbi:hypothetical protein INT43_007068 [Umbelopsis isabellina]|uniref:Uncharacterized protein n=1 Tax=Mortierella isabellina TaxID=91625 RepID=A0A8H7PXW2_MORIS|nr:hypothetical protein INT43_007068 [Umbelopsis isabellina]